MRTDVAIVGAGLAGSTLAIELGRRGYGVAVFEQSEFPREKPCGEGLMPRGVAALEEMGIATEKLGAEIRGLRLYFGEWLAENAFGGRDATRRVIGRGMRRRDLDAALARRASETPGVVLHTGMRVSAPLVEQGRVTGLVVEGQSVRAPLVVAADGARSRMRHALGLNLEARKKRVGMRMHFRRGAGFPEQTHVEIFAGKGYELYVTPLPEEEFLVAALVETEALRGRPGEDFRRWCGAQPALRERMRDATPVSDLLTASPLSGRARRRVLPGLVLLGDAAGFTDPITAGGMTEALETARMLAAHLAAAKLWNEDILEAFDKRREAAMRDVSRMAASCLWLTRHPRWLAPALQIACRAPRLTLHAIGAARGVRRLFGDSPRLEVSRIAA